MGNTWRIHGQCLGNTRAILGQKCFGSDNFASPYSVWEQKEIIVGILMILSYYYVQACRDLK